MQSLTVHVYFSIQVNMQEDAQILSTVVYVMTSNDVSHRTVEMRATLSAAVVV